MASRSSAPVTSEDGAGSSIGRRRAVARRDPSAGYIERRERLLAAAAEVFKAQGLEATSINDIAERMGSDRASVYYYFGSKQEIFLALVRQGVEEIVVASEAIAASGGPPAARLERLVQSQLEAYERHYPFIHLYIQEDMNRVPGDGTTAGEELKALGLRYEAAIESIIREGLAAGGVPPRPGRPAGHVRDPRRDQLDAPLVLAWRAAHRRRGRPVVCRPLPQRRPHQLTRQPRAARRLTGRARVGGCGRRPAPTSGPQADRARASGGLRVNPAPTSGRHARA